MPDSNKLVSIFLRHGETGLNKSKSFRGPMNIPLNETGIKQAEDAKDFLKNTEIGAAYSSDMDRVLHTSDIILGQRGIIPSSTPDLRSWNVGKFAGLPKADHQFEIKYYQENPEEKIPEGESLSAFRERVQPRIKTAIMAGIETGRPSFVATHSSVIHELSHVIYGDHKYLKVKPGGIVGVYWNGQKLRAKALLRAEQGEQGYGA